MKAGHSRGASWLPGARITRRLERGVAVVLGLATSEAVSHGVKERLVRKHSLRVFAGGR